MFFSVNPDSGWNNDSKMKVTSFGFVLSILAPIDVHLHRRQRWTTPSVSYAFIVAGPAAACCSVTPTAASPSFYRGRRPTSSRLLDAASPAPGRRRSVAEPSSPEVGPLDRKSPRCSRVPCPRSSSRRRRLARATNSQPLRPPATARPTTRRRTRARTRTGRGHVTPAAGRAARSSTTS